MESRGMPSPRRIQRRPACPRYGWRSSSHSKNSYGLSPSRGHSRSEIDRLIGSRFGQCCGQGLQQLLAQPLADVYRKVRIVRNVRHAVEIGDLAMEKVPHEKTTAKDARGPVLRGP